MCSSKASNETGSISCVLDMMNGPHFYSNTIFSVGIVRDGLELLCGGEVQKEERSMSSERSQSGLII